MYAFVFHINLSFIEQIPISVFDEVQVEMDPNDAYKIVFMCFYTA